MLVPRLFLGFQEVDSEQKASRLSWEIRSAKQPVLMLMEIFHSNLCQTKR